MINNLFAALVLFQTTLTGQPQVTKDGDPAECTPCLYGCTSEGVCLPEFVLEDAYGNSIDPDQPQNPVPPPSEVPEPREDAFGLPRLTGPLACKGDTCAGPAGSCMQACESSNIARPYCTEICNALNTWADPLGRWDKCTPCMYGCNGNVCNEPPAPGHEFPVIAKLASLAGLQCDTYALGGICGDFYEWDCYTGPELGRDNGACFDSFGFEWEIQPVRVTP